VVRKWVGVIVIVSVAFGVGALVGYRHGRFRRAIPADGFVGSAGQAEPTCVDYQEAGAHTGERGCVSGRVVRVFAASSNNTFLDFCPDYRQCPFSTVIFASDKNKFGNLQSLSGRQIEVRGPISVYQGRPQIIIHDPEQIRLVP
jgi:hypothetical protein